MTLRMIATAPMVLVATTLITAIDRQAVFRATVDVVAVDAAVTRGRTPVIGLGASDFEVLDNGVRQQVESVSQGNMPLDVTIVLDFSHSVKDEFPAFVASATGMQRLLRDEDRWRWLAMYIEARELLPWRNATEPLPSIGRPVQLNSSALFDTVFLALVRPGEPARRHLVVVFSDGNDTFSILDGRRLPEIAARADAVLHVVVSATPPAGQQEPNRQAEDLNRRWRESQGHLFDAAQESGGRIHRLANRAEAFARIIEEFRSAYVLRYTPRGVDTPGWHELKVAVTRPGSYTIRARKGYERR